ncbi:MAG: NAD(P)/FAD-dependent oxidoreductase [Malacoplasma sp.]
MDNNYDVVVIGSGNAGLIAATTLAKMKKKVLLLEKHNVPGGFATSFVRGRFEFEPALHELCDLGNKQTPGFVYKLFEELGIEVEWQEVPDAYRILCNKDGKKFDYVLPFGIEAFSQACEKYSPGSYKSVQKLFDICLEMKDAIKYLDECRGKPDSKFLKKNFPNYLTTASYTLKEVLEGLKMPVLARNIIEAYWVYLGLPSSQLSFTLYGIMLLEYIKYGAYVPTYRSHEISQAILSKFQEYGGEVWFNSEVNEIIVENNEIKGVVTKDKIVKTNHVVSNASQHIVYGKLIKNDLVPKYDRNLANWRKPGPQGYSFYLGLNKSIEELKLHDYSYFMYSNLDTDVQYENMKSIEKNNDYIVVVLNVANKKASPEGTAILSFTTLYFDAWNNVNEDNYFQVKNKIANRFIEDFEKQTNIKIKNHIEEIEVATPVTFSRYTSTANGAIYGYGAYPQDSILVRGTLLDDEVHIKGLRFCGGNAFRAHGYSTTYLSGRTIGLKTFVDIQDDIKNSKVEGGI